MTPKKIAVLGGGNGAHTMAAELSLKGHTVTLYEMPRFKNNMKKVFETKNDAIRFFEEGMMSCDPFSSEFARYGNIVFRLKNGEVFVVDEE